jgi:hypothetical protein
MQESIGEAHLLLPLQRGHMDRRVHRSLETHDGRCNQTSSDGLGGGACTAAEGAHRVAQPAEHGGRGYDHHHHLLPLLGPGQELGSDQTRLPRKG